MCSEFSVLTTRTKVQYLLRCHGWYIVRLLQLSPSTSSVDQHRGDDNTVRSPPAHTGSKIEARKQFRKCIFFFTQNGTPFSWESFTCWPSLTGVIRFPFLTQMYTHSAVEADSVQMLKIRADFSLPLCICFFFFKILTQQTFFPSSLDPHYKLLHLYRTLLKPSVCNVCAHKCCFAVTFFPCQSPKGIPW